MDEEKEIPEIKIEENQVVLPTINIPITVNGKESLVKMRKISGGKRRDVFKKHLRTSIKGQQINGEVSDIVGIQISILSEVIIDAPFDFTEKGLSHLPENVVDYLYNEYDDWGKKKQRLKD